MAFLKAIANKVSADIEKVEEGLVQSMNNLIQNQWAKITEAVLDNVHIYGGKSGKYSINKNANWTNIPKELQEQIMSRVDSGNIFSMLGFYYEDWLAEAFQQTAWLVGNENINKLLHDMVSQFNKTGALKSDSSIRGNNLDIRPDLAVGIDKNTVADVNNSNLKAELQVAFDIQNYRKDKGLLTPETIANDTNMLTEYIDSNMFGFSVKRWTQETSQQRVLTSASGMQQMINTYYNRSDNKTWNALYAYRTMVNILSRYLLDILGPVNVAFITGTKFEWTSDFLADALLTMNIYADRIFKNNEIHPYINSGHIYVQRFARGRKQALLEQQMTGSQYMSGGSGNKAWSAYQLRFAINNKK